GPGGVTLREQAEAQRSQLTSECEKLMRFLDQEERAAFSRLEDEEMRLEKRLLDNIAALE
uniref:Tripartite motif-containing protein 75 n=1 Tax=Mus musculus TaxID=10090 RepID=UPI00235803D5|nr:Chain A, Tripartite motif-containing protein 75 [Mus musculus]